MPALPGRVADTWVDEGTGGGGTTVHNLLTGRDAPNAHPTSAITNLDAELAALVPLTQKGAANGVATLDAGSKIPAAQIPALALSEFLGTVASEAAMLALVGQRGDWCIRTDLDPDSIFILETDDPTQAANWTNVTGPGVVSVDGNTGAITAGQLLTAILTVDGPGSGLNADLLDGLSSADFQQTNGDLTDLIARWVAASAAAPASLDFLEDTDNGGNKATVTAPAALGADRVLTLPDVTGTLLTGGQADGLYVPKSLTGWALKSVTAVRRSAGDINLQTATTSWSRSQTGLTALDVTAAAAVGDRARLIPNFYIGGEAPAAYVDAVTVVGGTPINSYGNQGAVTSVGPFFGVAGWRGHSGISVNVGPAADLILQAGDLDAGMVTVGLRCASDANLAKTLVANSNYAATMRLEIWTPIS